MTPLRIALVMIEPPLPFGNAAARWFYVLLRGLVERGHRVTAFAACGQPAELAAARDLFPSPSSDLPLYEFIPDDRRAPSPMVTLIGSMGWRPSYSAAVRLLTRLWPEIKRQVPDAKVQVVGWSAREKLAEFVGMPDVAIDENVPEIRP